VDEFLSEKEQIDRLRQWWRENGWFLIGGAALGALLLFGWNQYQEYRDRQAEEAAQIYESLKELAGGEDVATAAGLVTRLRNEHPSSAYTDQAGLLIARMQLISAPERAVEELRYVMESTKERELALIARLRLARVLAYREQYDEALQVLETPDPGQFAGRLNETKGDIYTALGRHDEARTAYLSAMTAPGAEVLDRNYLQMKLNDLPGSAPFGSELEPAAAPASSEAAAPDAAPSEPAADPAPGDTAPDGAASAPAAAEEGA
jgi:predicted negative regulator of RcsB-dependent stress response